ncbi:MAG: hypothetical protein K2H11_00595, partial [Malacoplasma sp.]|nr:hypothetical protein [Malacoplasma sp.]
IMSYYSNPFKYNITNHAIKRARERLHLENSSGYFIHEKLEECLQYSILERIDNNGSVFKNLENNITIIVDERLKIIKTVY